MVSDLADGIDVASWQHGADGTTPIGWNAAAGGDDPVRFVWIKATEGTGYSSPWLPHDLAGARAAGIPAGAYHFARFTASQSVYEQAQYFRAHVGVLDLPAALDAENTASGRNWLPSADANTDWVLRWFDSVGEAHRVLYTNPDGLTHHLIVERLMDAGVDLWLAKPTGHPDFTPLWGWAPSVVQYGSRIVPGIAGAVDANAMPADLLARWTGTTPTPAPPEDDEMPRQAIFHAPVGTYPAGHPLAGAYVLGAHGYTDAVRLLEPKELTFWSAPPPEGVGLEVVELDPLMFGQLVIREPGHYPAPDGP